MPDVAATLTTNDRDDACQIGPLLDQVEGPLISFTGDGAYDQDSVYGAVMNRDPAAAVVVPPRARQYQAKRLQPNPHSVIAISRVLPRGAGSAGKRCQDTTSAAVLKPTSDGISKSSVMDCAFAKMIVAPPKSPSPCT